MTQCIITENSSYNYCPSFGAAIFFSVLFGLSTILHLVQAIMYRKKFCWVIVMGGSWETAGFVVRAMSSQNMGSTGLGIAAQLLVLLSPLWVNAFDYMILGRMVYYYLPAKKICGIRAARLALWFVLLDVTAFLIQGTGGTMTSGDDPKTIQLGLHIYMGGIGFQEFFVLVFVALAIKLYKELSDVGYTGRPTEWRTLLRVLLATLVLITIRIIYRLVEFSQGVSSNLTNHEAYFYVLEATPMALALILLNVWHPGMYLVGPDSEFPKKEKKAKKSKASKEKFGESGETFALETQAV